MILTAILYIVSALGCALAESSTILIVFRVLSGLAVGATSVVAPMYISEIAPAHSRGRLVSFNQFAITIGIVLAYIFDYLLMGLGDNSWRYMLAVPGVFGVVFFVFLMLKFPESPRWLLAHGKKDAAIKVLTSIGGQTLVNTELPEMEKALLAEQKKEKMSFGELFKGKPEKSC